MQTISIFFLIVISFLCIGGCSSNGTLFIYNASGKTVILSVEYEGFGTEDYLIETDEILSIEINMHRDTELRARLGNVEGCYQIPPLPVDWVKSSLAGGEVYTVIDSGGSINLYPPSLNSKDYFAETAVSQPDGFPVKLKMCTEN